VPDATKPLAAGAERP